MKYPQDSIFRRLLQNYRTYGIQATFKKFAKRASGQSVEKQVSVIEYQQHSIDVFTEIPKFISNDAFLKLVAIEDESKTWYTEWKNWKSMQKGDAPEHWNAGEGLSLTLYMLVRTIKPSLGVETGTANGTSAAAILAALEVNQFGVLHTFDVYDFDLKYVPKALGYRVHKHVISKRNALEKWMQSNKNLINNNSIFLHDSNHSYEHQAWEYEIASQHGFGILISDDVDDSKAFIDLEASQKRIFIDGDKLIGICKLSESAAVNFQ